MSSPSPTPGRFTGPPSDPSAMEQPPVWLALYGSLTTCAGLVMLVLYLSGRYRCDNLVGNWLWMNLLGCALLSAWMAGSM